MINIVTAPSFFVLFYSAGDKMWHLQLGVGRRQMMGLLAKGEPIGQA